MFKKLLILPLFAFISCKQDANKDSYEKISDYTEIKVDKSVLDSLMTAYYHNEKFMGSIAVSQNGNSIYTYSVGFDDVTTNKQSNSNSKYRIGSISKTFTAVLTLMAMEEGKLDLQQSLSSFFPTIKNAATITIENLLNHRSGIHSYTSDQAFAGYHLLGKSVDEMLEIISGYESDFQPGSKAGYSNSNYYLLTLILEQIFNKSYGELIQEKICRPLKLSNTHVGMDIHVSANEAHSFQFTTGWEKLPETDMSVVLGAGSIVSTSEDLVKFYHALFHDKVVSTNSLEKMIAIKNEFGLGLERYSFLERTAYGHKGRIDGFNSIAFYIPTEKLSMAILSNSSYQHTSEIIKAILALCFNDVPMAIDETEIDKFVGRYKSVNDSTDVVEFDKETTTLIHIIKSEFRAPLIYKGNNRFLFDQSFAPPMTFTFTADGKKMTLKQGDFEGIFEKE